MPYVLSIDPGKSTGWAYGHYSNHHPYTLEAIGVIQGGLAGFVDWWTTDAFEYQANVIAVEGFRLRGSNNFTAALDGVEIIGFLKGMARVLKIEDGFAWQWPTDKALVPDDTIKALGFWQTGKMVNHTDGRDANDATIHGLAYLIKQHHEPTVKKILEVTS